MEPDLLKVLLAADDPEQCEAPSGFDWAREMGQVKKLAPLLERIASRPFTVDESVQDASFFTDLSTYDEQAMPKGGVLRKTILAVRFSTFGRLFIVWSVCEEGKKLDPSVVTQIVRAVAQRGYTYIDGESLNEPYSGPNPHLKGVSWRVRFFDYL
jgi:hypothetical protein